MALVVTPRETEPGNLAVSLTVTSPYPEIFIARSGAVFETGEQVDLRYPGGGEVPGFVEATAALPVLIWAETPDAVPFGAGVGRVERVDLGVVVESGLARMGSAENCLKPV